MTNETNTPRSFTSRVTKAGIVKTGMAAMIAVATIGGMMAATTTSASAGWRTGCWGCGPNPAWGYGAAAVATGLAVGAIAASQYQNPYPPACYIARERVVDAWGNVYFRKVRVCE